MPNKRDEAKKVEEIRTAGRPTHTTATGRPVKVPGGGVTREQFLADLKKAARRAGTQKG